MAIMKIAQHGIFALVFAFTAHTAAAEVVVIVSAKNPITALDADQVANIFLGKSATFPSGELAVPLDQPEDAKVHQEFYAKVTSKSPALLKAHWSKLLFTGKGQPPKQLGNDEAVKKAVAQDVKFIGYINKNMLDPSVKVVLSPK